MKHIKKLAVKLTMPIVYVAYFCSRGHVTFPPLLKFIIRIDSTSFQLYNEQEIYCDSSDLQARKQIIQFFEVSNMFHSPRDEDIPSGKRKRVFVFFSVSQVFHFRGQFHRVVSISNRFPVGKSLIQSKLVNKVAFHQFG